MPDYPDWLGIAEKAVLVIVPFLVGFGAWLVRSLKEIRESAGARAVKAESRLSALETLCLDHGAGRLILRGIPTQEQITEQTARTIAPVLEETRALRAKIEKLTSTIHNLDLHLARLTGPKT